MSSFSDDAKKVLDLAGSAIRGLELVGNLARAELGTDKGASALAKLDLIGKLVDVVKGGFDGSVQVDDVKKHIDDQMAKFEAGLAQLDADDQTAIDKKFPTG